jgi:phosphonate transport system substrate-binding protein
MIVVRDDSPIRSVSDLKGKRFAFGDKAALLQRAVVADAGIRLEEFKHYEFIGHYDNIVRAVMHGDFDAGILKDTMANKWQGKGIRILYASPPLPPYNISVGKHTSDEMYDRLKTLFLNLNGTSVWHQEVIHSLDRDYTGFSATDDEEYKIVRELIQPFE